MVEANIVLTLLQTISIMVGIEYYILNLQNNQKNQETSIKNQEITLETRQAQLFMNIFNNYSSKGYQKELENILSWQYNDYDARARTHTRVFVHNNNPVKPEQSSYDSHKAYHILLRTTSLKKYVILR